MQLITALLLLAAGDAVRATNDAQCAALGDAARADVCARDAHFYVFDGEDNCGAAFDRTHGADAACLTRLTNDATAAALCGVDGGALDAKPLGSATRRFRSVEAQSFESVEATCDETTKGVEFEDSSLPGLADYYEFYCDTPIENTTRDDQCRTLADVDELPVHVGAASHAHGFVAWLGVLDANCTTFGSAATHWPKKTVTRSRR